MPSDARASNNPESIQPAWLVLGIDWLTARERCILAAGVIFQIIFLLVMIVRPLTTLATGQSVLLRVVPIDPRDIFRGDYVTLTYEINRLGWDSSKPPAVNLEIARRIRLNDGQTVYVLLEPEEDGKHWRYARHQVSPPTEGKFIRGTAKGYGRVEYGIEQYFVQEGTGHVYEKAFHEKKLSAEVAIDKNGSAQIKRLIIE